MLFPAYWRDDLANNWYVIGLNYPGIPESGAGGYHLGPNQIMNYDVNRVTQQTLTTLQQDFHRIRNMGCRVVRMWAFTQGQGLRWQEINSEWIVTRIDPDFRNNVREITARAAQEGIKIYWTLFNGADFIVDTHAEAARTMKTSFERILTDRPGGRYRNPLLVSVLPDFLNAIRANMDGVFAIDLMNEPDVLWRDSILGDLRALHGLSDTGWILLRLYLDRSPITVDCYYSFFQECSDFIRSFHDGGIPISIGFCRFHSIQNNFYRLNRIVDFFDYHHYNHFEVSDTGFHALPNWNSLPTSKPCIIGECGLGGQFQREYESLTFAQAFRGTATLQGVFDAQAECISNIMRESYDRGYAGCLVWEYGKQYTDTARATSPYNPRNLDDQADWGDRFYMIWHPSPGSHIPARYDVPLTPQDRRIIGRTVVQELYDIFQQHRSYDRCPPL